MVKVRNEKDTFNKVHKGIIISVCIIAIVSIMSMCIVSRNNRSYGYYKANDNGNGFNYVYVVETNQKATYIGNGIFVTNDGKQWVSNGDYKVNKKYLIVISDEGTTDASDDIVVTVRRW